MNTNNRIFALFILGVVGILLVAGCTLNGGTSATLHPAQTNPVGTLTRDQVRAENDANCEIQEFNRTIVRNYTIVPLTEEDLKPYPEFGQYFESTENVTPVWGNDGTRLVVDFDCNESVAIRFYSLSRKYEEFPNQPVFEYHGRYYNVYFNSYIWHSLTEMPTQPRTSTQPIP